MLVLREKGVFDNKGETLANTTILFYFFFQALKSNPKLVFEAESCHLNVFQCGKDLELDVVLIFFDVFGS